MKRSGRFPLDSVGSYINVLRGELADPQFVSQGKLHRGYLADQFYRSMYGMNLQEWLKTFHPRQFCILVMEPYFEGREARVEVLRQMEDHFAMGLNPDELLHRGETHANSASHKVLLDELD